MASSPIFRSNLAAGDPVVEYPFELPFGYRPESGVLVPDDPDAKAVREIFESVPRASAAQIAQRLNARRVKGPRQQPWTPEDIVEIVTHPVYRGDWGGFGRAQPLVTPDLWISANVALRDRPGGRRTVLVSDFSGREINSGAGARLEVEFDGGREPKQADLTEDEADSLWDQLAYAESPRPRRGATLRLSFDNPMIGVREIRVSEEVARRLPGYSYTHR